ncbi:ABC transporter permease [Streptomyces thinghirensis]|nr:ABC transporter permease [Streptomyces thinghirensis]
MHLRTDDDANTARSIRERFGLDAEATQEGVRVATADGARWVPRLRAHPDHGGHVGVRHAAQSGRRVPAPHRPLHAQSVADEQEEEGGSRRAESITQRPGRPTTRSPGRRAAELAALRALVRRGTTRLVASPAQAGLTLLNPLLYFVVLGTGLQGMVGSTSGTGDYMTYVYPGILMMAVQMPALNAGMSIVRDRETGLLRAVLVAPVRRDTFLVGKCLGSTATATAQGGLLLAFAPLAGLPYDPLLLLALLGELALVAFTLTALVTLAAVRITRIETFQSALGVTMLPLFFLSGRDVLGGGPAGVAGRDDARQPVDLRRGRAATDRGRGPRRAACSRPGRTGAAGHRRSSSNCW